jgi:hypothetical protein
MREYPIAELPKFDDFGDEQTYSYGGDKNSHKIHNLGGICIRDPSPSNIDI